MSIKEHQLESAQEYSRRGDFGFPRFDAGGTFKNICHECARNDEGYCDATKWKIMFNEDTKDCPHYEEQ